MNKMSSKNSALAWTALLCLLPVLALGAVAPFSSASWIGAKGRFFHYHYRKDMHPAPVFAKDFSLGDLPRSAVLRISAAGYWDIRVNGRQITEDVLMPTPSNFDKRVYMKDYELGGFLQKGGNRIEVTLGNSIYNCPTEGAWMQDTITWRDAPQLLCEVECDGKVVVATDPTWRVHLDGPVRSNSIRCGEVHDARKEALSADGWKPVAKTHGPGGVVVRERHPPTRIWRRIQAVPLTDGIWDVRQNLAGFAEIKVVGKRGSKVRIRMREKLDAEGKSLAKRASSFVADDLFQTDLYILKGGEEETWHPRFVYSGFRYVEACVVEGEAKVLGVTACAVGSDLREREFRMPRDPALSNLVERTRWSIRSNMVGFPTDCPSREKQGWTGDALIAAESAMLLYDGAEEVYVDWLRGLVDVQRPNGQLPCKSPISANGYNWGYGPAWDGAIILIPELIFDLTGRDYAAREFYVPAKRYASFMDGMLTDDLAVDFGLGDWCAPKGVPHLEVVINTVYASEVHRALARFADRFGFKEDAVHFSARAKALKRRLRHSRYCNDDGSAIRNLPTALAVLAAFDVSPCGKNTAALLDAAMRKSNGVMNVGMFGAKYIPRVLARYGYVDTALMCFTQKEFPGWMWQQDQGEATTLWEEWGDFASNNHVLFADFPAWFHHYGPPDM